MELRTENVTRYIMPLREGGSLPALAEADDEFKYVVKFRGAGHGTKALIAELIGGEIARALGFRVPELVFLNLDEAFGRTEGDEEIQDLLQGSRGLNLGLHFLSGALTFDPVVTKVGSESASRIVWLDAFVQIKDHVLLPEASRLEEANADMKRLLTEEKIREIVALIPDDWLHWSESPGTPQEIREIYIRFLCERLAHSETFIKEAQDARKALI